MPQKKSWTEKLNESKNLPKVVKLKGKATKRWGGKTMAIPSPLEIDALMRKVPRGKLITTSEIRTAVAKKHKADIGCPLTSGIFTWIAANAAAEQEEEGKKKTTPYWRTLKSGGEINPKYPGGISVQKKLLQKEGHKIKTKGKKYLVVDYDKKLVKI